MFKTNLSGHNKIWGVTASVRSKKIYTEIMFVLVRVQFHNHVDTQPVKRFKHYEGYAVYIRYQIWNLASAQE